MIRYQCSLLLCLLMTLVSHGCDKESSTAQRRKVVVGYLPIIAHLPAAIAREHGKFSQLEIEFRVFGTSDDLMGALAKGDIDIATTVALAPLARYVSRPEAGDQPPNVLLFSYSRTTSTTPFDGVYVKRNGTVNHIADLANKKVGVFPGTTAKHILGFLLRRDYNVDPSSIEWVFLPPDVQLARLEEGDIDALYTYETIRTKAEVRGMRQIHGSVVASVLEGAPYGCSAINRKFATEYPDLATVFIKGFDEGIAAVRSADFEARRVLSAKLGVSAEVAERCNLEPRLTSSEITLPEHKALLIRFLNVLKAADELEEHVDCEKLGTSLLWSK